MVEHAERQPERSGTGSSEQGVVVRARRNADIDVLVGMAAAVQQTDGYPGRAPRDFQSFLVSEDALGAWVAEQDGMLAGHVALHRQSLPVVMTAATEALGLPRHQLAVIARLLVDPGCRRRGVGRALLQVAAADARRRGLHPILDVVTNYDAANALYRSCGWRNLAEVTMAFPDGMTLQSYVYAPPSS